MTDFEIILLRLVAKGKGQWSWYEIGNRLPGPYLNQASEMMDILKQLADLGYINHHTEVGEARDRWELSDKGIKLLNLS